MLLSGVDDDSGGCAGVDDDSGGCDATDDDDRTINKELNMLFIIKYILSKTLRAFKFKNITLGSYYILTGLTKL